MELFKGGIGIDLSDHHVRFAFVGAGGRIRGMQEIDLPHGLVFDERVKDEQGLVTFLNECGKTYESFARDTAVLLLPESRVFSASASFDATLEQEIKQQMIVDVAQSRIPIPFEKARVEVVLGKKEQGRQRVSMFSIKAETLTELYRSFDGHPFRLEAAEPNSAALYRLFTEMAPKERRLTSSKELALIVDVGYRWTNMSVFDVDGLNVLSRSVAIRPLNTQGAGGRMPLSAQHIARIREAALEAIGFLTRAGFKMKVVLLAGVEAATMDVQDVCHREQGCHMMHIGDLQNAAVTKEQLHVFGAAIGAALRGARLRRYTDDPNFLRG